VSYALHGGGLLSSPQDSRSLESYGSSGPGRHITIYANSEHAFMVVDGKRFDTVARQESGSRSSSSTPSTSGYVVRHPAGSSSSSSRDGKTGPRPHPPAAEIGRAAGRGRVGGGDACGAV